MGAGGAIFVRNGAQLIINDGGLSQNNVAGGIGGAGAGTTGVKGSDGSGIGSGVFLAGNATYSVTAGQTVSIADTIGGGSNALITGGFTKSGGGTLALSGANTYVGGTTVSAGTLLANNTGNTSATGSGVIQVQDTGTLGGTGRVSSDLSVLAGGTLAPGASIGTLNTGTVSLAAGSLFNAEIDAALASRGADLLNVTGGVSLGGSTLSLAVANWDAITSEPFTFLLIAKDGSDAISGTFASVMGMSGGYSYSLNYAFNGTDILGRVGTGNDVAITLSRDVTNVPGPLPVLGALAAFGWSRKIRRRIREAQGA